MRQISDKKNNSQFVHLSHHHIMNIFDKLQQNSTKKEVTALILLGIKTRKNLAEHTKPHQMTRSFEELIEIIYGSPPPKKQINTVVHMIYLQSRQGIFHCPLFSTEISPAQISLKITKTAVRAIA